MKSNLRTLLSTFWLVFTTTLVAWWIIFVIRHMISDDPAETARYQRMLFYEGSTLIALILFGGAVLIFLSYKDDQRHQKLKLFFSNFSHDIKTSIARLRLQGDILSEADDMKNNRTLQRLLKDISRLDLQLENSLLLANAEASAFLIEKIDFTELIKSIQIEFEDLQFLILGAGFVFADSRALRSIVRNLFENSRRHGQATKIVIELSVVSAEKIKISISDNGVGSSHSIKLLGQGILTRVEKQGNGIGLYLAKRLVSKMNGVVHFTSELGKGFKTDLILRGELK